MFLYIIIIIISLLYYFINYVSNALSVLLYAYDGDYRSMLMSHWMMIICCTIIEFPLLLFLLYYMLYVLLLLLSLCFHFSFFLFLMDPFCSLIFCSHRWSLIHPRDTRTSYCTTYEEESNHIIDFIRFFHHSSFIPSTTTKRRKTITCTVHINIYNNNSARTTTYTPIYTLHNIHTEKGHEMDNGPVPMNLLLMPYMNK